MLFSGGRKTKCRSGKRSLQFPLIFCWYEFFIRRCNELPIFQLDFAIQSRSVRHHRCWQNARRLHIVSVKRSLTSEAATHTMPDPASFELSDDTRLALSVSQLPGTMSTLSCWHFPSPVQPSSGGIWHRRCCHRRRYTIPSWGAFQCDAARDSWERRSPRDIEYRHSSPSSCESVTSCDDSGPTASRPYSCTGDTKSRESLKHQQNVSLTKY